MFNNVDEEQDVFNTIRFICDICNIDADAARLQLFINTFTVSEVNKEFHRKMLNTLIAAYHRAKLSFCNSFGEQITLLASEIMLT